MVTDTYYFNYKDAYKEARKQNKFGLFNDLQICYYNGEHKPSPYQNLIGVPIDTFCDYITETPNRVAFNIEFSDDFSEEQRLQMLEYLQRLHKIAYLKKIDIGNQYREVVKNQEPNFNEPLRILFITTRITSVLQYVTKNLADAFKDLGYSVFISIEENAMQSWGANDSNGNANFAWHLKNIYEFNPHITINLDWMNNTFLNDKVFNFVWFQDPMPILYNDELIAYRDRDYFFALLNEHKEALIRKGVCETTISLQSMATNPKIFYRDSAIEQRKKIVFLGTNYNFEKDIDLNKEILKEVNDYLENNTLTASLVVEYAEKLGLELRYFQKVLIPSFVRRKAVVWMCKLKDVEIEVYGTDAWLLVPEVVPFYKGMLPYGEAMRNVYNSACYSLCAHSMYRYQQRTIEISACETIPVVYHGNLLEDEFHHEDNILSFSTFDELQACIGKQPTKSPKQISEDISYEKMAMKIIEIVKQNV